MKMNDLTVLSNRNIIKMSNSLNRAKYHLTPIETDIIFKLITEIDKEDTDFKKYIFKVVDLEKSLGRDLKGEDLKKISKTLLSKPLQIKEGDDDLTINWVSSFRYKSKTREIEIKFDPELKPYLIDLKDKYLKFEAKTIFSLSSSYSKRIYTLLLEELNNIQFIEKKKKINFNEYSPYTITFKIEDLQNILDVPVSLKVFKDFRKRVIEQSFNEIKNTEIPFSYEFKKTNGKYTDIIFTIFDYRVKTEHSLNDINYSDLKEFREWFSENYRDSEKVLIFKGKTINFNKEGFFTYDNEFYQFNKNEINEIWELLYQKMK